MNCGKTALADPAQYGTPLGSITSYQVPGTGSQEWFRHFHPNSQESTLIPSGEARLRVGSFVSKLDSNWNPVSPVAKYYYKNTENAYQGCSLGNYLPDNPVPSLQTAHRTHPQQYMLDPWWPVNSLRSITAQCANNRYCSEGDYNMYNLDQFYAKGNQRSYCTS